MSDSYLSGGIQPKIYKNPFFSDLNRFKTCLPPPRKISPFVPAGLVSDDARFSYCNPPLQNCQNSGSCEKNPRKYGKPKTLVTAKKPEEGVLRATLRGLKHQDNLPISFWDRKRRGLPTPIKVTPSLFVPSPIRSPPRTPRKSGPNRSPPPFLRKIQGEKAKKRGGLLPEWSTSEGPKKCATVVQSGPY